MLFFGRFVWSLEIVKTKGVLFWSNWCSQIVLLLEKVIKWKGNYYKYYHHHHRHNHHHRQHQQQVRISSSSIIDGPWFGSSLTTVMFIFGELTLTLAPSPCLLSSTPPMLLHAPIPFDVIVFFFGEERENVTYYFWSSLTNEYENKAAEEYVVADDDDGDDNRDDCDYSDGDDDYNDGDYENSEERLILTRRRRWWLWR